MQKLKASAQAWLVAHRGDRAGGVENTLAAFEFAASSGALFAECDVQFTKDYIAVVLHDDDLKRLCNKPQRKATALNLLELQDVCRSSFALLSLKELLIWLQQYPALTLFVEIKDDILKRESPQSTAQLVTEYIASEQLSQIVIISKAGDILDACKLAISDELRIGWVAEGNNKPESKLDYIFMPYEQAATIAHWHDLNVNVGLYTINHTALSLELRDSGADLIETDMYSQLKLELDADDS